MPGPGLSATFDLTGGSSLGLLQPLADIGDGKLGDRLRARLESGVLAQADQRGGTPAGRDLVVQQAAERPEYELVEAEVGDLEPLRELGPLDRVGRGLDQDLEVLLDARVGLGGKPADQLRVDLPGRLELPLDETGRQVGDLVVVALDAKLRRRLGLQLRHQLDHELGILVALLDPVGDGPRGGLGRRLSPDRETKIDGQSPAMSRRGAELGGIAMESSHFLWFRAKTNPRSTSRQRKRQPEAVARERRSDGHTPYS